VIRLARRAEWIWRARRLRKAAFRDAPPPYAAERNRHVFFRRSFELSGEAESARVHVSADGRYRLFVNGEPVGFGPARFSPDWPCADPHDLAPRLRPGRNVVAALVHSYGRDTSWYERPRGTASRVFGCGGFFLQGEVTERSGATLRLDTDSHWIHREARAWNRKAAGGSLGFNEIYDAREDPPDWAAPDFDDSDWLPASALRIAGFHFSDDVVPFPVLFERDIPALATKILRPSAIAATAEVGGNTIYKLLDCSLEEPDTLLAEAGEATVRTTESRDLLLVLDFGRIVFGSPRLDLEARAGATVDLTYGDELDPDSRVRPIPGIPGFDAAPEHRYTTRAGRQSWEQFEPAGFRYLQATFRGATEPLKVDSIRVVERLYSVPPAGRFRCSDELLNRIWEAGARTLSLCMHDAYVDCPTREQRQWVADASLEALVNYAVFGDAALAARFLRQVAQAQRSDGRTPMCAPGDFAAADFLSIPDFTLAWILAADRHHLYAEDSGLARELLPSVGRALAWFERWLDADGLLAHVPGWVFLDWAEHDKRGEVTALNAAFVAALRAAARLAGLDSRTGEAERLDRLADGVAAAINERLWDERRGVYVDARRGGKLGRRVSQLANASLIANGIAPAQRWPRILSAILDPERVTRTRRRPSEKARPFDPESGVIEAQPYGSHLLHRALAAAGRHDVLLDHIRSRWGPMLDSGSTFWETWETAGWDSRCHGYSSTPAFELSSEILGVFPNSPGFARFRVAPHPAGLEWAEGSFPTPRGPIGISWMAPGDGGFELAIDVPDGCQAQVLFPEADRREAGAFSIDGSPAPRGGELPALGPGKHRLLALR
jgi:alpha-L-rhamnosidase